MAAFAVALLVALAVPMLAMFRSSQSTELSLGLSRDALVIASDLAALPETEWPQRINTYEAQTGTTVVAVTNSGRSIDPSVTTPTGTTKAELSQALTGEIAAGTQQLTNGQAVRYVAVPVTHGQEIVGAVRLSLAESVIDSRVRRLELVLIGSLILVLLATLVASWAVAKVIARPLKRLVKGARKVGQDPTARVGDVSGPQEIQDVADALDETAAGLDVMLTRSRAVAADASHNLRTPLAAMRLRLENLAEVCPPEQVTEVEEAIIEVDRLTRRVNQVLALATAESTPGAGASDVGEVVDRRTVNWQDLASSRGVDLLGDFVSAPVAAPAEDIDRIVDELVGNALTYAESQVRVQVACPDSRVVLTVADDGPGIPATEREAVFDRFRRGTQAAPGGTGLGLALVKQSAEHTGGEVRIEDTDQGTTIAVEWPRRED